MSKRQAVKTGRLLDILLIFFVVMVMWKLVLLVLPFPELDAFQKRPYSLAVLDRRGVVLRILALPGGERREFRPLSLIPAGIKEIFLQSEDNNFYIHGGIDLFALLRAMYLNATHGEVISGGSTITMQLARIISPHEPGMGGKLREMWDALRLEARLSKEDILTLWLNSLPFGSNAVGIESASKTFFGFSLESLSPSQALMLAVIPKRPSLYHPRENPKALKERALILAKRIGLPLSETDFDNVLAGAGQTPVDFQWPFLAPHFVNFVADQLSDTDFARGEAVRTSLDLELNELVEAALGSELEKAGKNRIFNGAVLVVDNVTGEICAWVGSQNFFDEAYSGQIDGVRIKNQPGSTLKPFLYALALDSGFDAASILPDIPSRFGGEEVYIPQNFTRRFSGPVRIRNALGSSLNVPAVHMLERLGVRNFVNKLVKLDFASLEGRQENTGVGLAVGNAPVSLYELVQAFSVFARDGYKNRLTWKLCPEPADPSRNRTKADMVFSPASAGIIRDILSDRVSRVTGFGPVSVLNTSFTALFKTGTSNQYNNIWALGALPRHTMGVWMGNFSGETVIGSPGSTKPAQVVALILSHLARPESRFPPIRDVHQVRICTLSGGRAHPFCPSTMLEYFAYDREPAPCSYHTLVEGRLRTDYPPEFQVWAAEYGYYHDTAAGDFDAKVSIISPNDGSVFYLDPGSQARDQVIRIEAIAASQNEIALYVNGALYAHSIAPLVEFLPMERGFFDIRVEDGNGSDSVRVQVR